MQIKYTREEINYCIACSWQLIESISHLYDDDERSSEKNTLKFIMLRNTQKYAKKQRNKWWKIDVRNIKDEKEEM